LCFISILFFDEMFLSTFYFTLYTSFWHATEQNVLPTFIYSGGWQPVCVLSALEQIFTKSGDHPNLDIFRFLQSVITN
jgi:hypothetical protein